MPTWLEKFGHFVGRAAAPLVQRSAPNCLSTFSQCRAPVLPLIMQDADTAGGVCEALSCEWIIHHANGGSLWNWLTDQRGNVKTGPLWQVMHVQRIGMQANNQNTVSSNYLQENGIVELPNMRASAGHGAGLFARSATAQVTGNTSIFSARALATAIAQDNTTANGRTGGQYKKIGIEGKAGAHAMAAWVAEDVCFFDPNFGEFWFRTRNDFINWFAGSFWLRSMYFAGLSGRFEIFSYSKRAGM